MPVQAPPGDGQPSAEQRAVHGIVAARIRGRRHFLLVQLGLLAVLIGSILVAVGFGAVAVPPRTVLRVVTHHTLGWPSQADWSQAVNLIVWEIRLPRVVLAALLGAGLALAGMVVQALVRNPLAEPATLGVQQGAGAGAVLVLALGYQGFYQTQVTVVSSTVAAFVGALVAIVAVFALAQTGRSLSPLRLLLVGVALSYGFGAFTDFALYAARDPGLKNQILFWLLGSLAGASWPRLLLPAIGLAVILPAALLEAGSLDAISSGDETARALGIDTDRFRRRMLGVLALFIATSVVAAGTIAFVGLVTPHVARLLIGADHRRVGASCILAGAAFLVLVDLVARLAFEPSELPLSVVTAVVGVPFFIWLLRRRRGALRVAG